MRVGFNYDGTEDVWQYLTTTRRKCNIEANDVMRLEHCVNIIDAMFERPNLLLDYPYVGEGWLMKDKFIGTNSYIHNNGMATIKL
jgi:hypothetical protein